MKAVMKRDSGFLVGLLLFWLAFGGVQAAGERPDVLMRTLTDQVMERLLEQEEFLKQHPDQIQPVARKLINEVVLPHMDMKLMSRWVIGKGWNRATAGQRQQFVDEFTGMLVRTYASAMLEFRGSQVAIKPLDGDPVKNHTVVRTEFINSSGDSTPVLFRVRKDKQGEWKVFDMVVDGISLVKNYRSSFGAEIRKVGIDGLIKRLASHNNEKQNA